MTDNEKLSLCPECNWRLVPKSNIRIDEYTKRPACRVCRLKMEMMAAPCAYFAYCPETGEIHNILSLWEKSKSKVLKEKDTL